MKMYLLYGWIILFTAIILNLTATSLKVTTWYGYFELIAVHGFIQATASLKGIDLLFLYIVYPGFLGFAAFWSGKQFIAT